jgi:hypothetical protein
LAKKGSFEFDAAGWLFWIIVFAILVGPAIYGSFKIVYDRTSRLIPFAMGVVGAAIGAGVVSWAVNAVVQRRRKKKRLAERKKIKKRK